MAKQKTATAYFPTFPTSPAMRMPGLKLSSATQASTRKSHSTSDATLTLTYGADLYAVSKLLGHCNIRTTQIYAKIVDENKRKAVNLVPKI